VMATEIVFVIMNVTVTKKVPVFMDSLIGRINRVLVLHCEFSNRILVT
jgi:hypothetical protein